MAPPTLNLGHPGGILPVWSPGQGAGWVAAGWEDNPDLTFPWNVYVYDKMRRTDTQVAAILRAVSLPLRAVKWTLDADDTAPEVAAFVADNLNLGDGAALPGGVSWDEHLREALLALAWGFAPFETVYEVAPGGTPGAPRRAARLARLALRPPRTLTEVRVTRDGDLEGIVQAPAGYDAALAVAYLAPPSVSGRTQSVGSEDVFIPRDRLAYYCLDREGGDWTGTSLLRAAYKDWWLKEQMIRAAGQAVERNSMGLPVVAYDDDGDRGLALDIATAARAGATAGLAVPRGRMEFTLQGVTGATVDPLPLIQYHDQAMTRSALAMFLDLGHDNGARSLGDTFVDFFTASLRSLAEWIAKTATAEIVDPLVRHNFGPDAPVPALTCEAITARQAATADAIKTLVDAGVVTPDEPLEAQVRRSYGLPEADPATAEEPEPAPALPFPPDAGLPDTAAPGEAPDGMPLPDAIRQARALTERLAALAERVS